jgi:MazG family protein
MKSVSVRRTVADDVLELLDVMTRLRARDGCPWDAEQTLASLRPYLLEEAHEVLEVMDRLAEGTDDAPAHRAHCDELGDLLFQIVFQAEIQREAGRFDFGDVAKAIHNKLVRRHPHVFGGQGIDGTTPGTAAFWEAMKRQERQARGEAEKTSSSLDGVPKHLPALLRAFRLGEKAHGVGFDWPDHKGVIAKIREELGEIEAAITAHEAAPSASTQADIASEVGDLLYAVSNLSRHVRVDAEAALRGTMHRFEERFREVERRVHAQGKLPEQCSLDELEAHWQAAKQTLRAREA